VGKEAGAVKPVEGPLDAIRTAKQFLYYAWFLYEAVVRGAITPETFTDEIPEGEMKLSWPPENRTPAALERHAWNNVLAAMSISAIAADRALDDTFGAKPQPAAALSDQDATRVVMYMLRCAYAHDPLNPRWECRGPYLGVFRINALDFELDTRALHGQPWNIAHVGGPLGYFNLLAQCQGLVATALGPAGPASA
jgi:hypothetical protein